MQADFLPRRLTVVVQHQRAAVQSRHSSLNGISHKRPLRRSEDDLLNHSAVLAMDCYRHEVSSSRTSATLDLTHFFLATRSSFVLIYAPSLSIDDLRQNIFLPTFLQARGARATHQTVESIGMLWLACARYCRLMIAGRH